MLTTSEKQVFQSLIDDWFKKSQFRSGMCDNYLPFTQAVEIAKTNKEDYLPLLFDALIKDFRWYQAIYLVMGEGPSIDPEDAGKVNKIVDVWVQFGREKGFVE